MSVSNRSRRKTEGLAAAAHRTKLSYQQLYRLVLTGRVLGWKVGTAWKVSTASLNAYLRRERRNG